jgi:hypothetical protein
MAHPTDHPPSTDDSVSRNAVRRAIIGGAAGLALLVGPVILANVVVPDGGQDRVEAAAESQTSLVALRRSASVADLAKANAAMSLRTTTTPPPPPPTEPPPPPTTEPPTTAPPATEPEPASTEEAPPDNGGGLGDPDSYATWDALADCESGGNWQINTGNGYYGGLQFSLGTWQSVGGTGLPSDASRETQILMGQRLQARSGWGSWPACSRRLGFL